MLAYSELMVKSSSVKNIPRPYLILGVVSLALNLLVIIAIVVLQTGKFDYMEVNYGIDKYCSEEFKQIVTKTYAERDQEETEGKEVLALMDYTCSRNGAGEYFEKGYKEYARSIGLDVR